MSVFSVHQYKYKLLALINDWANSKLKTSYILLSEEKSLKMLVCKPSNQIEKKNGKNEEHHLISDDFRICFFYYSKDKLGGSKHKSNFKSHERISICFLSLNKYFFTFLLVFTNPFSKNWHYLICRKNLFLLRGISDAVVFGANKY